MSIDAWRPRIKPEHRPWRTPDGRIRIGGNVYSIAAEVADPTGVVWTMLSAADGSRTVDEVVACVCDAFPDERPPAVRSALELFAQAGYMENCAAPDPDLSERERERYSRGMQFYRWVDMRPRHSPWDTQLRLRDSRAVVLGLGGTGGTAALSLAASGVGRLHCVDRDVVELSNLNRQILFTEDDLGQQKVEVALRRLRAVNSDIEITGEERSVQGPDDVLPLLDGCDVFVLCADQPGEIRAWVNRACLQTGTAWVEAGYHGPVATAAAYTPGEGACYECVWLAEHERNLKLDPNIVYGVQRGGSNAVTAPPAGLSGNLAAHLTISLLTGASPVTPGQVRGVNLVAPDQPYLITTERRADCPACGGRS